MGSKNPDRYVDVLIIGAGPAGMMASMYLSELNISHRIVDHRGTRTLNGRADGFHVPTVEIWESFGIHHHIEQHAERYGQWCLWTFNEEDYKAGIVRSSRAYVPGHEKPRLMTGLMNQGMIEAALGDGVRARGGPDVERGTYPVDLAIDEKQAADWSSYPITAQVYHALKSELPDTWTGAHTVQEDGSLKHEKGIMKAYGTDPHEIEQHVNGTEGTTETVHAKYLIGTDGAHSWVRRQLPGFKMEGDNSDMVFGVLDIIPHTNFPDIRKTCSILSHDGFVLLIPRENGMVRLYVQFPEDFSSPEIKAKENEKATVAEILKAAKSIFHPYTMDYKYCDWWTIYRIGQRVCNKASYLDRVFLAGDAIHTHSPKGGQGMNVSQQDTYNLSWKIASVLRGSIYPEVLKSYESERLPIAHALISVDNDMGKVLTARANRDEAEVQRVYQRLKDLSGPMLSYKSNLIIGKEADGAKQKAASGLPIGFRFPEGTVYSQADGYKTSTLSLLKSNGLWRVLIFAGDVSSKSRLSTINAMSPKFLALQQKFSPTSPKHKDALQILLFHSSEISAVESEDFHDAFFPVDGVLGRNYFTLFGDFDGVKKEEGEKGCHESYGIDTEKGALCVVRPDQVIAWVGELGDVERVERWFGTFMVGREEVERRDSGRSHI